MSRSRLELCALTAAATMVAFAPIAGAQVANLSKGHQLLVDRGLQIWGCDTGASSFTYSNLTGANLNAVMWSHGQSNPGQLAAGQKWGKWVDYTGSPATALSSVENAHYADLVAIQVGDEQQTDIENPNSLTTTWFQNARNGNYFNDKLLYVNSFYINSDAAYATFIANANPDAISWDAYPFGTGGFQPYNWLGKAQQFRRHALGSYINNTSGNAPRPYGLYLQTYSSSTEQRRDPGDLEMRWQQFTAWTLGNTFVDAFTVGGATSLFNGGSMASPNQPRYNQFKETAQQSRNLGPALVRLISYSNGPAGGGTSIVRGKDPSGNLNPLPISWQDFSPNDAPPNQRYLQNVSAVNLGTKNNGQPGDVYIGFFNPLHASYGNPAGTTYFMVTNALGAYLQDPTLLVSDCRQQITMDFDFGASGINSLLRLNRNTGLVETIHTSYDDGQNTVMTSLGGSLYRLQLKLDGGTGDLFKYNDGAPFVGVPYVASTLYWDSDGLAANNNAATGAGLGGIGNWDASSNKWYNGISNAPWVPGSDAVFSGTAGTVTLSTPQSANSVTFKSTGYSIAGSTLTMSGSTATVDAGVTATISSVVAGNSGLVKDGPGTLNLTTNNSYAGGTTINQGVLGIISGALGANPPSPIRNITINNGATLRFNQNNLTLTAQRQIELGAVGGVVDTAFTSGIAGVVSGGPLMKTGIGTLQLSNANTHSKTVISGGAVLVNSDENLGAVPASFAVGNVTLDGGALRFGADFDVSNNRGITLGANGGTIDTQGFSNPTGYTQPNGISGSGNLTKIGSGTFFMNTPSGQLNNVWTGNLILKEGTWRITERGGLPFNPPQSIGSPVVPGQITFDGGTLQIAAAIPNVTNGRRGITVAAGGGTFDTQSFTLNWAGPLAGNVPTATLTKVGSGTLQFNSNSVPATSTYVGTIRVAEGGLVINNSVANGNATASIPLASINLENTAGVSFTASGTTVTIGSLAGGGATGGNATLHVDLIAGGNNNSTTFAGVISGSGGLTKTGSGVMKLTGSNSFTGSTIVASGTLAVDGSIAGGVTVQNGGTLAGAGAIGGPVAIESGGSLSPGNSPGTLTVGALTLASLALTRIDIGPVSDQLISSGDAALGGALEVSLVPGFTPSLGQTFTVLTASSVNGKFAATAGPVFSHLRIDVQYHPQSVILTVVPALDGDFNADGAVDAVDYIIWRKGLGTTFTLADYDNWRTNFGRTSATAAQSTAVPEPQAWILLGAGGVILLTSRIPLSAVARCIGGVRQ